MSKTKVSIVMEKEREKSGGDSMGESVSMTEKYYLFEFKVNLNEPIRHILSLENKWPLTHHISQDLFYLVNI